MPQPDRVTIWYRGKEEPDIGKEIDLNLALNFNATTLKYSIAIN